MVAESNGGAGILNGSPAVAVSAHAPVASLGGDTLQGVTPEQRIVNKRRRTGEKGAGWHPPRGGGDTRVKSIKVTVMSKRSSVFQEKNEDDTAELTDGDV